MNNNFDENTLPESSSFQCHPLVSSLQRNVLRHVVIIPAKRRERREVKGNIANVSMCGRSSLTYASLFSESSLLVFLKRGEEGFDLFRRRQPLSRGSPARVRLERSLRGFQIVRFEAEMTRRRRLSPAKLKTPYKKRKRKKNGMRKEGEKELTKIA